MARLIRGRSFSFPVLDFLAAAARLNACSVIRNADGVIEVKFDRKPHEKVKRERKRDASSSAPPAKRVKTETAKKWEPRRLRPDDGDQAITDTFCDPGLWTGKIEAPTELPTKLNVLETFAGAGGLYFGGTGSRGNRTVSIFRPMPHGDLVCVVLSARSAAYRMSTVATAPRSLWALENSPAHPLTDGAHFPFGLFQSVPLPYGARNSPGLRVPCPALPVDISVPPRSTVLCVVQPPDEPAVYCGG